jgi:probable HAF family extracellular repeat protein
VNADGTVVVGDAVIPGAQAFRWVNGTMTGLGFLTASGVNADGTVVVGQKAIGGFEAVRWVNGTVTGLGFLPGDRGSKANGVSANGKVVVGLSTSGSVVQAVRWVKGTITGLGFLPSSSGTHSEALGVSANGKVVVGNDQIVVGGVVRLEAFRWVNGTMTGLGSLPGDTFSSASGVNANGRVVVGESFNPENQAFRWVNGTMTGLGFLPGGQISVAFGVSANGKVVVGNDCCTGVSGAFRWTAATGMQSVKALLQAAGVDIPGWQLGIATAVSADGTTIVGNGIDPDGRRQAWIADLSDLCFAEGMPVLRLDEDGNPIFLRARCEEDEAATD